MRRCRRRRARGSSARASVRGRRMHVCGGSRFEGSSVGDLSIDCGY